jgi:hypothetical protein
MNGGKETDTVCCHFLTVRCETGGRLLKIRVETTQLIRLAGKQEVESEC